MIKTFINWISILLIAAALLYGRFDWVSEPNSSLRSYFAQLFCYILFLPSFYYVSRLIIPNPRVSLILSSVVGTWFALPYRWLGLQNYYLKDPFIFWINAKNPQLLWYPAAFGTPDIPSERIFFFAIGVLGFLSILIWSRFQKRTSLFSALIFPSLIFLLLLTELSLHLSLHSPYTYLPHFEQESEKNYWYLNYLFADGSGAVNADYTWYRQCEESFLGIGRGTHAFWTRMFPIFLSVQFTRFWNPYYVWLVMNLIAWGFAIWSMYFLGRRWFDLPTARYTAIITAAAPGFMLYGGQPKIYVLALASLPIMLALFEKIFRSEFSKGYVVVFGVCLGFFMMTYEGQPWLLAVLVLGRLIYGRWKSALLAVGISALIALAFTRMGKSLPELVLHPTLQPGSGNPIQNAIQLFLSGNVLEIFSLLKQSLLGWKSFMGRVFYQFIYLAVFGLFTISDKQKRNYILILALPSLLTYAIMCLGKQPYYLQFPRIVYSAFPAVYLSIAVFLVWLQNRLQPKSFPKLGSVLAILLLATQVIYWNMDVFGHPLIYFKWFYRDMAFAY